MLPPSPGLKQIHSTLMMYNVCSLQQHYQPITLQCQNQYTTSEQTPPRKPAKIMLTSVLHLMWLLFFNQSQCLDISNTS